MYAGFVKVDFNERVKKYYFSLDLYGSDYSKVGQVDCPPIYDEYVEAYDAAQVAILYLDDNGKLPNLAEKLGKL